MLRIDAGKCPVVSLSLVDDDTTAGEVFLLVVVSLLVSFLVVSLVSSDIILFVLLCAATSLDCRVFTLQTTHSSQPVHKCDKPNTTSTFVTLQAHTEK